MCLFLIYNRIKIFCFLKNKIFHSALSKNVIFDIFSNVKSLEYIQNDGFTIIRGDYCNTHKKLVRKRSQFPPFTNIKKINLNEKNVLNNTVRTYLVPGVDHFSNSCNFYCSFFNLNFALIFFFIYQNSN